MQHATEFEQQSGWDSLPGMLVLAGKDRHLKQSSLQKVRQLLFGKEATDDEFSEWTAVGKETDWTTVHDELRTVSMWGDCRLIIVSPADDFVSKFRSQLENYTEKPAKKSVLVLDVASFPGNTRLAKRVPKCGLIIDCSELTGPKLLKWITTTAERSFQKTIKRGAAQLLVELVGTSTGLLESELSKLTSYVGQRPEVTADDIQKIVGGWKAETTWAMLNAIRDGHLEDGLKYLDQLLSAGEPPQKLQGGVVHVFRRIAEATERSANRVGLQQALKDAGVFFREIDQTEAYLRRIGRAKAETILPALQEVDQSLKGMSALPERILMERLMLTLSGAVTVE